MSLWWCDDCKIAFAPGPACPRCGKGGVWQRIGDAIGEAETLRRIALLRPTLDNRRCER